MFKQFHPAAIQRTPLAHAFLVLTMVFSVVGVRPLVASTACPFCSSINLTFTEQLEAKDIAVVAKLLVLPKPVSDPDADLPKASLEITKVLKGDKFVQAGMKFNVTVVGTYPLGQEFLVMGVDPPNVSWTTPMKVSERVFEYLEAIQNLPESGADRLVFFQDFFEDKESVLAFDAYDEFAKASYDELSDLKERMQKDRLMGWIEDLETSPNRRRLYLTMLGVCGGEAEASKMEKFIKSGDRKQQAGLDALLASYLTLKGADGLPLLVDTFLKDSDVEYVDTLAAVSALRFHGTEVEIIPREKVVEAIRHVLDRPKMADMVIPDLARWQDWSVMERLVQMFKDADEDTNWLRVPVITYLNECPKPEAKSYIEELKKIDPDAVQRAEFFAQSLDGFLDDDDSDDDTETEDADIEKIDDPEAVDVENDSETPAAVSPTSRLDRPREDPQTQYIAIYREQDPESVVDDVPDAVRHQHVVRRVPTETESGQDAIVLDPVGETFVATTGTEFGPAAEADVVAKTFAGENNSPVAVVPPVYNLSLSIIFIPMAVSVLLFVALWSVVSGWFERLIF